MSKEMFLVKYTTAMAIGVPGTTAGIFAVHEKWAPCLFEI
jgi:hypothetical protein